MTPATPRDEQLQRLIAPVVERAGYDLETLNVSTAGRRRIVRVVVDSDDGVSLDDVAEVSRSISESIDAQVDAMGQPAYTLEVTSPGVDRPLELPRHWRRAVGRLVKVEFLRAAEGVPSGSASQSGSQSVPEGVPEGVPESVEARVVGADDDGVDLDVGGTGRRAAYAELRRGRVQVEFSRPDTPKGSARAGRAARRAGAAGDTTAPREGGRS